MSEITVKSTSKPKRVISIILGTGIVLSVAVNIYLYSQFASINKGTAGIQTKQASGQKEYNSLSLKVMAEKKELSIIQKENSQLNIK